jgi:hypothetical protein
LDPVEQLMGLVALSVLLLEQETVGLVVSSTSLVESPLFRLVAGSGFTVVTELQVPVEK